MAVIDTADRTSGSPPARVAPTGPTARVAPTPPTAAEGLLADRQVVWGNFTRVVFWSSVVIAALLVVLVGAVL